MPSPRTYLDYNATAPLRPQAHAAMIVALDVTGNASSVHAEGRRARTIIETAREQVAALVGAKPSEVVFTSGGTEANNAILKSGWDAIVVAGIEHDSVLGPARSSSATIIPLPIGRHGAADPAALHALLGQAVQPGRRVLVSMQMANNETGVLQSIVETAEIVRGHGARLHTDAVQAVGRIPVTFDALGADALTLSAHKIGGPKGIGALVVSDGVQLAPLILGGGQELGQRAGTENVAGIAAFGAAAKAALRDLADDAARLKSYRDRIEQAVLALSPDIRIIGQDFDRLPNTSCIAVPGMAAETLVIALDLAGIAVSAGAACSSGKVKASHVLTAMGHGPDIAGSAIRISTGWSTTTADIDAFLMAFGKVTQSSRLMRKVA